ncbi:dynein light chain, type 1/2 [Kipferlia bialata]|uniref:Dynein light chain n=1 Tax=Kipferlia bialata TaxID=797122 RepID=A0A9K3GNX8_9EUKA|nr:dynein light chain, type 1/2 [Kipferlia bialata]|eukprot:g11633.t1
MASQAADGDGAKSLNYPLVLECDMGEEERVEAVETVVTAVEKFPNDLEAASKFVKAQMDKQFGSHYHCIVGGSFSFCVNFEIGHRLQMCFGSMGILVFKAC